MMMPLSFIIVVLGLGAVAWLATGTAFRLLVRDQPQSPILIIGSAAFQFFIVSLVAAVLLVPQQLNGAPSWAIALAWPIVAPVLLISSVGRWWQFLGLPLLIAIAFSLISAIWLRSKWIIRPGVSSAILVIVFIAVAEVALYVKVSLATDRLALECLVRRSFIHSLRISGAEHQFNLHSTGTKNGTLYAWSFHLRDFYAVPDRVIKNVRHGCAATRR